MTTRKYRPVRSALAAAVACAFAGGGGVAAGSAVLGWAGPAIGLAGVGALLLSLVLLVSAYRDSDNAA